MKTKIECYICNNLLLLEKRGLNLELLKKMYKNWHQTPEARIFLASASQ